MNLIYAGLLASFAISQNSFADHLKRDFATPDAIADSCDEVLNTNLSDSGITLKASSGGTSAYAKIIFPGQQNVAGAIIPPNSSGIIDGEVTAYRLSLLLGQSENVQPATLKLVKGEELTRLQSFMKDTVWTHPPQLKNQAKILTKIADSIQSQKPFFAALKCWSHKPRDYDELLNADHTGLDQNNPIAKWMRADQAQPSKNTITRTFDGHVVQSTELTVAKELSTQFLIDAIMGQWDRFSGGNLQVFLNDDGTFHFGLFDNGGTWGEESEVKQTLSYVTRFEKEPAQVILDLDQAISNGKKFHGATEEKLKQFLEMDQELSVDHWEELKHNLKLTADHIRSINRPDTEKYFE